MSSWFQVTENSTQTGLSASGRSLVRAPAKSRCRPGCRRAGGGSQALKLSPIPRTAWLCSRSAVRHASSGRPPSDGGFSSKQFLYKPQLAFTWTQLDSHALLQTSSCDQGTQGSPRLVLAQVRQLGLPRPSVGKACLLEEAGFCDQKPHFRKMGKFYLCNSEISLFLKAVPPPVLSFLNYLISSVEHK